MKKTHKGKEIKGTPKTQHTTQKKRSNGELVLSHHKSKWKCTFHPEIKCGKIHSTQRLHNLPFCHATVKFTYVFAPERNKHA